jgi:hypothetical protein
LEEILVQDPRHPLFGRRFKVVRMLVRVGNLPQCYEVEYLGDARLNVPVAATQEESGSENRTKLSVDAVYDLIAVVELLEHGVDETGRSVGDIVAKPASTSSRRIGDDTGGDAP